MLALLLLACSTGVERPDPIIGCWSYVEHERIQCFKPDGSYRYASPKVGNHTGSWERKGDVLTIRVDPFPADDYTTTVSGEKLTMHRDDRPDTHYERLHRNEL